MAAPATLVALALLLAVTPQQSQADSNNGFLIDHYQIYKFGFPLPSGIPFVVLQDQFGVEDALIGDAVKFGVPVDKNGEGISRPDLHNLWWDIETATSHPLRHVIVKNQFGDTPLTIDQPLYLINPANKNQGVPGNPDNLKENHYKCYEAFGPDLAKTVTLNDQYGGDSALVAEPVLLCNPVTKIHPDGTTFPPPHPDEHLVCYFILTGQGNPIPVEFEDQFINDVFNELILRELLCVPSLKQEVVQTEGKSWGKIKSIYR